MNRNERSQCLRPYQVCGLEKYLAFAGAESISTVRRSKSKNSATRACLARRKPKPAAEARRLRLSSFRPLQLTDLGARTIPPTHSCSVTVMANHYRQTICGRNVSLRLVGVQE